MADLILSLVTLPVKTILFLTSPTYFKSVTNIGKILITNDNVLDANKYYKENRRVVVTYDNGKNIKVNKIMSDKSKFKSKSIDSKENLNLRTIKLDYRKYPKSLDKESVVDVKAYSINQRTKRKLTINDTELKATGETLSRSDIRKINNKIYK